MIAIDPGISTGVALFNEGWLVLARRVTDFDSSSYPLLDDRAVIEKPTVYPRSKADPNNLITLAIRVGRYQENLEASGYSVRLVEPRTWKHQVPKPIHHRRILTKLSAEELRILADLRSQPDVMDAVGLGLWYLQRLV